MFSEADATEIEARPPEVSGVIELRYAARAGLLPELSRQTYDSFYKAVRECVLNALDADATRVQIDLSSIAESREFCVDDDGEGMSMHQFCDQFMSLGGSTKFGQEDRVGRIGIGSLALLSYGEAAMIETKQAGTSTFVRACVDHAWGMEQEARRALLGDLRAGTAEEVPYDGAITDHFTRVRILGARSEVRAIGDDPSAFYGLVEKLRRVQPRPWCDSPLSTALARAAPSILTEIQEHVAAWSIPVIVHSPWERSAQLARRL